MNGMRREERYDEKLKMALYSIVWIKKLFNSFKSFKFIVSKNFLFLYYYFQALKIKHACSPVYSFCFCYNRFDHFFKFTTTNRRKQNTETRLFSFSAKRFLAKCRTGKYGF